MNLDLITDIKKIDKDNLYASIETFSDQIEQAWDECQNIILPTEYKSVTNIVICGMGGSALGGRIIDSLLTENVRLPIEIFTEARLPFYVNERSLVILSSYSGNTEETLISAKDAVDKKAKIFGICSGGKLSDFLKANNLPAYVYNPSYNPSKQPRMGLGYPVASLLAILAKYKFIHLDDLDMKTSAEVIKKLSLEMAPEVDFKNNEAKLIAHNFHWKIPILIASEHLVGSTHTFKNQLNENAKTFACLFDLPEANHHLMEGLKNPAEALKKLYFLFIESNLYSDFVKKRYPITKEVIEKNGIECGSYKLISKTKLEQIFELITLGLNVSYYLAILNETDPTPIPWVDYFKAKLK
jgi:glucose/mannose-6-phosphate isomerase